MSYSNVSNLNKHKRTQHEQTREVKEVNENLKCEQCNKYYSSRPNLNKHKNKFHGIKFSCKECDKHFQFKTNLRRHHETVHVQKIVTEKRKFCDDDSVPKTTKYRRINNVVNEFSKLHESIKKNVVNTIVESNIMY